MTFAQFTIYERVAINPSAIATGFNFPSPVPHQKSDRRLSKTATTNDSGGTCWYPIDPLRWSGTGSASGDDDTNFVYFADSGVFTLASYPNVQYRIFGGCFYIDNWIGGPIYACGIGAPILDVKLNNQPAIDFRVPPIPSGQNCMPVDDMNSMVTDTLNEGIDVRPYLHPGVNTWSICARGQFGVCALWITPLILEELGLPTWAAIGGSPDTIYADTVADSTSRSIISFESFDACDSVVNLDPATQITFWAQSTDSQVYGRFVDSLGDTLCNPVTLSYGAYLSHGLLFQSNGKSPSSPVDVVVAASEDFGDEYEGPQAFATVTIKPSILISVASDKDEVAPSRDTLHLSIDSVTISVSNKGRAQPGVPLCISISPVLTSGGHDHEIDTAQRPVGKMTRKADTSGGAQNRYLDTTDSSGKCRLAYTAGLFGGQEVIVGRLVSDTSTHGSDTVTIRVGGLQAFPTTGSPFWRGSGAKPRHTENHYYRSDLAPLLQTVLTNFYIQTDSTSGMGGQIAYINDMSLI